jgi:hypothetical protein
VVGIGGDLFLQRTITRGDQKQLVNFTGFAWQPVWVDFVAPHCPITCAKQIYCVGSGHWRVSQSDAFDDSLGGLPV